MQARAALRRPRPAGRPPSSPHLRQIAAADPGVGEVVGGNLSLVPGRVRIGANKYWLDAHIRDVAGGERAGQGAHAERGGPAGRGTELSNACVVSGGRACYRASNGQASKSCTLHASTRANPAPNREDPTRPPPPKPACLASPPAPHPGPFCVPRNPRPPAYVVSPSLRAASSAALRPSAHWDAYASAEAARLAL